MFSHHILKPERTPIEANPWGTPKSSGAFRNLFRTRLLRALEYRKAPAEINGAGGPARVCSEAFAGSVREDWPPQARLRHREICLSCGDSAASSLPTQSVDLVVTDPPFFDNVHYSELADFFFAWQRLHGGNARATLATTRHPAEVQDASTPLRRETAGRIPRMPPRLEGCGVAGIHVSPLPRRRLAVARRSDPGRGIRGGQFASDQSRDVGCHAKVAGQRTNPTRHHPGLSKASFLCDPGCRRPGSTLQGTRENSPFDRARISSIPQRSQNHFFRTTPHCPFGRIRNRRCRRGCVARTGSAGCFASSRWWRRAATIAFLMTFDQESVAAALKTGQNQIGVEPYAQLPHFPAMKEKPMSREETPARVRLPVASSSRRPGRPWPARPCSARLPPAATPARTTPSSWP